MDSLFSGVYSHQPLLLSRLRDELAEAACEFRENPASFLAGLLGGESIGGKRRKSLLRLGLALAVSLYGALFIAVLLAGYSRDSGTRASLDEHHRPQRLVAVKTVASGDDRSRARGGGGGGDETPSPASDGNEPRFRPVMPLIAPDPRPAIEEHSLAADIHLLGDSHLTRKRDDLALTGLPDGVPGPPTEGPGSGNGLGTGSGGGAGSGEGPGSGPGRGGGRGDGEYNGARGGGSRPAVAEVDSTPILLTRLRPDYTEEARRNRIQGVIRMRILVGEDGSVRQVILLSHLPDGLDEQAIAVAHKLRFIPAKKTGVPVPHWVRLDVEFYLR